MRVHTFGDSHSRFGFDKISNIKINWLGPILCYTFGNKGLDVLNISNFGVNENDAVIFCFGEIDCRAHIYRFVNETTTHEEVIDKIVENYIYSIKKNVEQFKNLKTLIYNIVPPGNVIPHISQEDYVKKVLTKEKNDIPWKGSHEDRQKYHLYFNKKLKEWCIKNEYMFIDVYNHYCDNNGYLKNELSDGNVHIENPTFIKNFLIMNRILP